MSTAEPVASLTTDLTASFPELARARADLTAGKWPAVSAYLAQLTDPHDVWYAIQVLSDVAADDLLHAVAADEQSTTIARAMLAARLIEAGWTARSGYRAKHVSSTQFATFHDYLRRAERGLIELTAREPQNVTAWTLRLLTARGLELGKAETQRRYDQAAKHDPHHVDAQLQMLQTLCPKWSGSLEEMHSFARSCMDAAPEGTSTGTVVAIAHLEHWMELGGGRKGGDYLRQPDVQREVADAAARSVLHPSYRARYRWVWDHNAFAMVFSLAGNHQAAAVHFRALGNQASEFPWQYGSGDPLRPFREHRTRALKG